MNSVHLRGNLTRDPELKFLADQTAVVNFGLAMNEKWKSKSGEKMERVDFIDCTAFGKTAETINQHLQKGDQILIAAGRLRQERWEDKTGGGNRSKIIVLVDRFEFIGGKKDDDGSKADNSAPANQGTDDIPF